MKVNRKEKDESYTVTFYSFLLGFVLQFTKKELDL